MDLKTEVQTKLDRVRRLMALHHVDALWLRRVDSVAWITSGVDVSINVADELGVASVVITPQAATIHTNTIEAPRLAAEDRVEERGFTLAVTPWEQDVPIQFEGRLAVDAPHDGALDLLRELRLTRARLLPPEIERFRRLGGLCAEAMQRAILRVKPGHTEHEIAAALAYEVRSRGVTPTVVLIATDERVHRVRHPLPTRKVMDRYAMLVLGGRLEGLACSVTRLVHFGALPDDLRRRMDACAEVDGVMNASSQPGATLAEIFRLTQGAYARVGFEGEWKLHHQGGLTGYGAREFIATPAVDVTLEAGMVCAWNPSITGTKCEDTILVTEGDAAPEILTPMYGWPTRRVVWNGIALERPLIMEVT